MEATNEVRLSAGTVRYRDTGAQRDQPTLVFVHGLLVDGTLWDGVVAEARSWARCIVPDLPLGSHAVPMDPAADLAPPAVAKLIAELLETLELRDVTLVANDTGGALAQMVAAWHPDRLGRLVLTPCDAFDNFLPAMFRPLQAVARIPGGPWAVLQPARIKALHATPLLYGSLTRRGIPTEVTSAWLDPALRIAGVRRDLAKFLRGIARRQTQEAAARLTQFDRPALVVWGDPDRVFPREHGERLARLLPRGRFASVPDSGAFLPVDQPGRLAELIQAFVREPLAA